MLFVPHVPMHSHPSERAEQLSRRLADTVDSFRREHSDLSARDIQQAMHLALSRMPAKNVPPVIVLVVVAALALAGGLAFAVSNQKTGSESELFVALPIVAAAVVLFGLFAFLKNR